MNKFVVAACLVASGISTTTVAAEPQDYVARLNDNGLYCARVEIQGINGLTTRKNRCRSLAQWERAGYIVNAKEVAEVE